MDKEKAAQPPMPKLPEPPPAPAALKKGGLTRREKLIAGVAGLALAALGVLFVVLLLRSGRTPRQAVDAFAGEELAVQEEIIMVSLPQNSQRNVYFYISDDKLACALLSHSVAGFTVDDAGGSLRLTGTGSPGIWKMLGTGNKDFFVFGLLYDERMNTVTVNGQSAVVVDNGTHRCWFYYAADGMSIDSESVVYSA